MGKKLGLGSLFFKLRDSPRPPAGLSPPSPWHFCKHPKTISFRDAGAGDGVFKTVNSVYLESNDSCFTSDHERSVSTASSDSAGGESSETVVRRRRSDRLFFDRSGSTRSIMEEAKEEAEAAAAEAPFEDSVALAVDSEDPYGDFRRSMEEMVSAHGLGRDWEQLEELLVWYLRLNGKETHRLIVGAFVDLLVAISASSSSTSSSSSSSSSSSFKIEGITEEETNEPSSSSSYP
ncbi:transcription repressor OFP13-like [Curcuma longa]|uniref:transcription repressor OFP13-like n=1 Tax=Curcuma longa TaxID=136217 RepID=UPI003D9F178F